MAGGIRKYAATVSGAGGAPMMHNEWLIQKMAFLYAQGDLPDPKPDPRKSMHNVNHQTEGTEAEEEAERRKRAKREGDAATTQEDREGMQD